MDILAALPKTPGMAPEALWAWLKRNGKVHPQELIRYKTTRLADPLTGIREKYAACNCTACGESWHTTIALPGEGGAYPYFDTEEGPRRNGEPIHCPNCGTAALVAHEKRLDRWPIVKKAYPWEIRKAGGCVMFICWAVIHETGYDWESTIVEQRNAYVIDPGGHWHRFTAMDRSGYSSMSTMYYTGCWYEMARFQVADGNFSATLPHSADVYEGTPLENAKLALLAKLGPQDREEVAGDLANITVTELQKLIDEKNDMAEQLSLLSAPPAAEAEAHEVDVEAELKKAADQARAEAEAKAAADLEAMREQHRKALEEAEAKQEERLQAARREAEKAAAEKIRQAKRDAEADAVRREAEAADKARKAAERTQKERDRAELEKAQQAAAEAQEQAEALQKKLGIQQSPAGAKFALLFEDVQQKAAAIMDLADEMRDGGQQELADKFTSALAAALRALADQAEGGEA